MADRAAKEGHGFLILVSPGELVDRRLILQLKLQALVRQNSDMEDVPPSEVSRVEAVSHELGLLHNFRHIAVECGVPGAETYGDGVSEFEQLVLQLAEVHRQLWEVEDGVRRHESRGDFDEQFVALARQVYQLNDRRHALKGQLNRLCRYANLEVKVYK